MKMDFIKSCLKQVVCWILLLQMINISIDPPDLKHSKYSHHTNQEEVLLDETESVYEWIAEGVFDEEVPESNEDDIDTSSPSMELYFFTATCTRLPAIEFPVEHFSHYYSNIPFVHQEPRFPPPKRA